MSRIEKINSKGLRGRGVFFVQQKLFYEKYS